MNETYLHPLSKRSSTLRNECRLSVALLVGIDNSLSLVWPPLG